MQSQFFRSFYLVFAGLFVQLLLGAVIVTATAAYAGNTLITTTAACMTALCALLIQRAVQFMRD
jgi:hypothetical protein